jgi:hypothetical protein
MEFNNKIENKTPPGRKSSCSNQENLYPKTWRSEDNLKYNTHIKKLKEIKRKK